MLLAVAERLHLTQIQIGAEIGGVVIAGAQTSRQRRLDYGVGVITVRHRGRMLIKMDTELVTYAGVSFFLGNEKNK